MKNKTSSDTIFDECQQFILNVYPATIVSKYLSFTDKYARLFIDSYETGDPIKLMQFSYWYFIQGTPYIFKIFFSLDKDGEPMYRAQFPVLPSIVSTTVADAVVIATHITLNTMFKMYGDQPINTSTERPLTIDRLQELFENIAELRNNINCLDQCQLVALAIDAKLSHITNALGNLQILSGIEPCFTFSAEAIANDPLPYTTFNFTQYLDPNFDMRNHRTLYNALTGITTLVREYAKMLLT